MNTKQKTALVSTLLNTTLCVLKFLLYSLTGSLAILADAWHSFSDIFTSLLVYLSVRSGQHPSPEEKETTERVPKFPLRWKKIPLETRISLFIGFFILAAALGVIWKVITAPSPRIPWPFLSGLCFIIFSIGSYIVYKFETRIGQRENSTGLIADGLHSKADMVSSLLVGFAMILLQLGINVDKPAALIISVFIFSFALETFVNFGRALKGKTDWDNRVTMGLVTAALDGSIWSPAFRWLRVQFKWENLAPRRRRRVRNTSLIILVIFFLIILASNCFFRVGASEQAIRERLGKPLHWGKPLGPGLQVKLPWPVEKAIKVNTRSIRSMNAGNVTTPTAVALLWTRQHGTEQSFLSGDNNFFYPYIVVHYRIKDIFAYLYNHEKPEMLLDNATHRLMTQIFSTKPFYKIATTERRQIEDEVQSAVQQEMDSLKTGLEITTVNIKDIHPPVSIADSFEEVISALQEKAEYINQAKGYRNSSLPEARGWAARSSNLALSYVKKKLNTALGDTGNFLLKQKAARSYPVLVNQMLYLQAIKEALANKPLILIDPETGAPDIWLRGEGLPKFIGE